MTKKTVYTLNIGNYCPEITGMTYPLMKRYAHKIGADFFEITERKWPDWPVAYEKLQIHRLGREHKNDWNIFFDQDFLIHPDFPDITTHLDKERVFSIGGGPKASERFKFDKYFEADGRNISVATWFNIVSDRCLDLWHPADDLTPAEVRENTLPIPASPEYEAIRDVVEVQFPQLRPNLEAYHFADDYVVSRNLAKFRLPYHAIKTQHRIYNLFFHLPLASNTVKIFLMRGLLNQVRWRAAYKHDGTERARL